MEKSQIAKPSSIGHFLVFGIVALVVIFGIIALFYNHEDQKQTNKNNNRDESDEEEADDHKPIRTKASDATIKTKTTPIPNPSNSKKNHIHLPS